MSITSALGTAWRIPGEAANSEGMGEEDAASRCARLEEELAELEEVVSAAVLVATVFRLRDEDGLIDSLRRLAEAVAGLEQRRPEA